ncbi:hypothetical protein SS50377_24139 [Spironucleus salmonicida]|uniref:Uncharacterized protein n=1 Tax=Spironucleus salmonicida TaxID=348837 RepID=V6LWK4_9EUKA|nr:hypothetical protein SS50377_24139 [Spironucleus salmonicida]|eukprot:EST49022.1 Hypothetical protein SS50377_10714 [Spironucleus salmonicida]
MPQISLLQRWKFSEKPHLREFCWPVVQHSAASRKHLIRHRLDLRKSICGHLSPSPPARWKWLHVSAQFWRPFQAIKFRHRRRRRFNFWLNSRSRSSSPQELTNSIQRRSNSILGTGGSAVWGLKNFEFFKFQAESDRARRAAVFKQQNFMGGWREFALKHTSVQRLLAFLSRFGCSCQTDYRWKQWIIRIWIQILRRQKYNLSNQCCLSSHIVEPVSHVVQS